MAWPNTPFRNKARENGLFGTAENGNTRKFMKR
jgi:hypothetical protein